MNERCAEQAGARIYMVKKLKKRLQIAIYMHIKKNSLSTAIQCSRGRGQRDQAWAWGVKPDVWRQIPDLSGKSYCSSNMATGVFLYCIAYCNLLYVCCTYCADAAPMTQSVDLITDGLTSCTVHAGPPV